MTAREWIGGTLWRAALLTAITMAAGYLLPWPRTVVAPPPLDVDRVEVRPTGEIAWEITDSAHIASILQFFHGQVDARWRLTPDNAEPFSQFSANFYRDGKDVWYVRFGPLGFIATDMVRARSVRLSPEQAEELEVLMDPVRFNGSPRVLWPRITGIDPPAPSAR